VRHHLEHEGRLGVYARERRVGVAEEAGQLGPELAASSSGTSAHGRIRQSHVHAGAGASANAGRPANERARSPATKEKNIVRSVVTEGNSTARPGNPRA
jgi:hypothetical protein